MPQNESIPKPNILHTVDEFIAMVPWDDWRAVLIYRRQHGGRTYVRLRTWNQHRKKLVWYPTKRSFVIPIKNAKSLADALNAAARGDPSPKPDWLIAREEAEPRRLEWVKKMKAPAKVIKYTQEVLRRRRRRRA